MLPFVPYRSDHQNIHTNDVNELKQELIKKLKDAGHHTIQSLVMATKKELTLIKGISDNKVEKLCDLAHITLNKNAVFGDASALSPGGVRIGAPAMTSRGLVESDFVQVAEFLHEVVQIGLKIQAEKGKMLKQFMEGIEQNQDILNLRTRVEAFAKKFEMPGFDVSKLS